MSSPPPYPDTEALCSPGDMEADPEIGDMEANLGLEIGGMEADPESGGSEPLGPERHQGAGVGMQSSPDNNGRNNGGTSEKNNSVIHIPDSPKLQKEGEENNTSSSTEDSIILQNDVFATDLTICSGQLPGDSGTLNEVRRSLGRFLNDTWGVGDTSLRSIPGPPSTLPSLSEISLCPSPNQHPEDVSPPNQPPVSPPHVVMEGERKEDEVGDVTSGLSDVTIGAEEDSFDDITLQHCDVTEARDVTEKSDVIATEINDDDSHMDLFDSIDVNQIASQSNLFDSVVRLEVKDQAADHRGDAVDSDEDLFSDLSIGSQLTQEVMGRITKPAINNDPKNSETVTEQPENNCNFDQETPKKSNRAPLATTPFLPNTASTPAAAAGKENRSNTTPVSLKLSVLNKTTPLKWGINKTKDGTSKNFTTTTTPCKTKPSAVAITTPEMVSPLVVTKRRRPAHNILCTQQQQQQPPTKRQKKQGCMFVDDMAEDVDDEEGEEERDGDEDLMSSSMEDFLELEEPSQGIPCRIVDRTITPVRKTKKSKTRRVREFEESPLASKESPKAGFAQPVSTRTTPSRKLPKPAPLSKDISPKVGPLKEAPLSKNPPAENKSSFLLGLDDLLPAPLSKQVPSKPAPSSKHISPKVGPSKEAPLSTKPPAANKSSFLLGLDDLLEDMDGDFASTITKTQPPAETSSFDLFGDSIDLDCSLVDKACAAAVANSTKRSPVDNEKMDGPGCSVAEKKESISSKPESNQPGSIKDINDCTVLARSRAASNNQVCSVLRGRYGLNVEVRGEMGDCDFIVNTATVVLRVTLTIHDKESPKAGFAQPVSTRTTPSRKLPKPAPLSKDISPKVGPLKEAPLSKNPPAENKSSFLLGLDDLLPAPLSKQVPSKPAPSSKHISPKVGPSKEAPLSTKPPAANKSSFLLGLDDLLEDMDGDFASTITKTQPPAETSSFDLFGDSIDLDCSLVDKACAAAVANSTKRSPVDNEKMDGPGCSVAEKKESISSKPESNQPGSIKDINDCTVLARSRAASNNQVCSVLRGRYGLNVEVRGEMGDCDFIVNTATVVLRVTLTDVYKGVFELTTRSHELHRHYKTVVIIAEHIQERKRKLLNKTEIYDAEQFVATQHKLRSPSHNTLLLLSFSQGEF
eukprot:sb/3461309/